MKCASNTMSESGETETQLVERVNRQHYMYGSHRRRVKIEARRWLNLREKAYGLSPEFFITLEELQNRLNWHLMEAVDVYREVNEILLRKINRTEILRAKQKTLDVRIDTDELMWEEMVIADL